MVVSLGASWPDNVRNGLLGKLDEAQKALDHGNAQVAVKKLQDFIDQVEGQRGQNIPTADAEPLQSFARGLIILLTS